MAVVTMERAIARAAMAIASVRAKEAAVVAYTALASIVLLVQEMETTIHEAGKAAKEAAAMAAKIATLATSAARIAGKEADRAVKELERTLDAAKDAAADAARVALTAAGECSESSSYSGW